MSNDKELQDTRARINQIDEQIQTLINERARCAQEIARLKNPADSSDYYRPEREAEVLHAIMGRNQGPLSDEEMVYLFREIMSACLALQHPLKISYLGPQGTYTHAATLKHFGHSVTTVPQNTIDTIFREVESGATDYGVVPIENSTEGVVNYTLDMFMNSPLKICGEVELRIHHHLLSNVNGLADVQRIYAHQQTLAQCREWLDTNMANIECIAVSSNAEAARLASEEQGAAAIAGDAAADIYKLEKLASNIEDEPDNTTRFLVIGRKMPLPSDHDKTSLLVSAANRPGALNNLLKPFADHDISMTSIESRPSRRAMWDYVFFIDIVGHVKDTNVAAAIEELEAESSMLKVLGSYPAAVL